MFRWRNAGPALAVISLACLAGAGCQSSAGSHAEAVSASAAARSAEAQITSSPQFKAAEAHAGQCVKHGGSVLTVWHCIAPKGHSRQRNACIRAAVVDNLSSKARRSQIPVLAAACSEKFA